jgi:hypothetical protein
LDSNSYESIQKSRQQEQGAGAGRKMSDCYGKEWRQWPTFFWAVLLRYSFLMTCRGGIGLDTGKILMRKDL